MSDDLVKRLRDLGDHASFEPHTHHTAADRIEELEAKLAEAADVIKWFIDNDETNEGDYPMPDRGNKTWNEINAYWIDGLNRGRALLAELTGGKDEQ